MFIDATTPSAKVCEPTVLTSLSVRVRAGSDGEAGGELVETLGDLGTLDDGGEHVWLSIEELRNRAVALVPDSEVAGWTEGFNGMVTYALAKGWASPEGTHLRAHIERTG